MAIAKDSTQVPALARVARWLSNSGRSQAWLSQMLGVSRPSVYRWVTGENTPEAFYRRAIHDLSKGEVHFDDWYSEDQLRAAYAFNRTLKRRLGLRGIKE